MSGAGEKEGERARKKGITGGMEERKGGLDIPIKVGARVGGRGIGLDWERYRRSPQSSNSHGKKKGGGRKGGRGEGGGGGKIWTGPRQTRKPTGWLAKRRGVTVTGNDGLNSIREAQDEASRIGTKPSGVMTR